MTPTIRNEFRFFTAIIVTSFLVWSLLYLTQRISKPDIEPISNGYFKSATTIENARNLAFGNQAEPISLMHYFPVYRMQPTYGTYWFQLPDQCPEAVCSIFIPRVSLSAEIYFNNQLIGRTGSTETPIANAAFRPHLFNIPSNLYNQASSGQKNIVKIVLASEFLERGRLWPFYVAGNSVLQPVYDLNYFLNVSVPIGITILLLFGCALALLIWYFGIRDSLYLWFALLIGFSALSNLSFHWVEFPYSTELRQNLYTLSGFGAIVCLPPLLHRFYGYQIKIIEQFCLYYSIASVLFIAFLMVIDNTDRHYIRALLLTPAFALLCLYEVGYLVWHRRRIVAEHLLTTAVALILFSEMRLYDIYNIATVGHWLSPLSRIAAPLTLLVFIVFFMRAFVAYYRESMATTAELDRKISLREQQLQHQQSELIELKKQKALQDERQRIMREIHDGAGGLLVSLILQAKSKKLDQPVLIDKLKQTLTDIRLMVDSLDTIEESLATALGMFRVRIEPLLHSADIKLRWQIDFEDDECHLSAEKTLHLFRILQEACTNAIKHSQCSEIKINAQQIAADSRVEIRITDNGTTATNKSDLDSNAFDNTGRGLKNMQFRAQQIGADLQLDRTPTGYSIYLAFRY